jgi:TPR repeat protein
MYFNGKGGERSYSKAAERLQKSAEAGNPIAMNDLAILYEEGKGFGQDK